MTTPTTESATTTVATPRVYSVPGWAVSDRSDSGSCADGVSAYRVGYITTCDFASNIRAAYGKAPTQGRYRVEGAQKWWTVFCHTAGTAATCWDTASKTGVQNNAVVWFSTT